MQAAGLYWMGAAAERSGDMHAGMFCSQENWYKLSEVSVLLLTVLVCYLCSHHVLSAGSAAGARY